MYNGTNTESYGSTIQSRGSGYSPYGSASQQAHLQPKDMVSFNDSIFAPFFARRAQGGGTKLNSGLFSSVCYFSAVPQPQPPLENTRYGTHTMRDSFLVV